MKRDKYTHILNVITVNLNAQSSGRRALSKTVETLCFTGENNYNTILSIFLNFYQVSVKLSHHKKCNDEEALVYFNEYMHGRKYQNGINIVKLAEKYDIPPALLSRLIVQEYIRNSLNLSPLESQKQNNYADGNQEEIQSLRLKLSQMMKNIDLIKDQQLRADVLQAFYEDICYGTINDALRSAVGLEYENKLLDHAKKFKIAYLLEGDLQKRGYDKTPDLKLEVPILIRNHTVCWIESKASFGDENSHKQYLREQYYSYWNRFGPGLVIYWFDFIEDLANDMKDQGILLMNRFPTKNEITFFNHSTSD